MLYELALTEQHKLQKQSSGKRQAAKGGLCDHSNRQHVAEGLEQPAVHFHNRKGQCCGSRGFRDANKIHSGSLLLSCSTVPVYWTPFTATV